MPGRQRLAAPFPVQPGLAGDRDAHAITFHFPAHTVKRLAVIVRGLPLAGFLAVTLVAVQHQGAITAQTQVVAKTFATGSHLQAFDARPALQRPIIDPGPERLGLHAGLADTAARQGFARLVTTRPGQGRVPHPQVGAVPVGGFRAGAQGRAEQGPLGAPVTPLGVLEVGSDVPPFDAKAIVCAMVTREFQAMRAGHLVETVRLLPQPGIAWWRRRVTSA